MARQFFTRTGDEGMTGLLGEGRVTKHDPRIEAVGEVDEATACLGVARSQASSPGTREILLQVQRDLYHLMAELAATPENAARFYYIDKQRVTWLETQMVSMEEIIHMPAEFIIPGDTPASAALDLARTVVRRAERRVSELIHSGLLENKDMLSYLNRLSSLCFVLELFELQAGGRDNPTLAKETGRE